MGAWRALLLATAASSALFLAGPPAAKAQGIEDINSDTAIDSAVNATAQSNAAAIAILQVNANAYALIDLNTADALPVSIVNALDIVTVNPGEIGINAQSLAVASVTVDNSTTQSNSLEFSGAGNQAQFFLQANRNEAEEFIENAALADTVSVNNNANITADGDGITALSQATGDVAVTNASTQTNSNSLTGDDPDLHQFQFALQVNKNKTAVIALNGASSSDVSVSDVGDTSAGQDGIDAGSVATATTTVSNTSSQTNTNALIGTGDEVEQLQFIGQVNKNLDLVAAESIATSGNVTVGNTGGISAGGNGINALSSATATTTVNQQSDQTNTNSMTAGGQEKGNNPSLALQGQLVGQLNLNGQAAVSAAGAESGSVTVDHSGGLDATGDGIVAESDASATTALTQTASQTNTNSAAATLSTPEEPYSLKKIPIDIGAVGVQGQLVGQINLNGQFGLADAEASSGDVSVTSVIPVDPAGGTGILAQSVAAAEAGNADAPVAQTVTQTNTNSADITLPPLSESDGKNLPDIELAAQLEGVLQVNGNLQAGLAAASASSGVVTVDHSGPLSAGADGIFADSTAVATSALDQSATQTNTDTKSITRAPTDAKDPYQPLTIDAQLEAALQANVNLQLGAAIADATSNSVYVTSADQLQATGNGITAASDANATADLSQNSSQTNSNTLNAEGGAVTLQGELVVQANLNLQAGAAITTATSGDVQVEQTGSLKAGGDGITARSSATASSNLTQVADQQNSNAATASLSLAPLPEFRERDVSFLQPQERPSFDIGIGVQAQLKGQANLNAQLGLAASDATSGSVDVLSYDDPSGGTGIDAESNAVAVSSLSQTVTQDNTNTASITFAPQGNPEDVSAQLAAQLGLVGQVNASLQAGAAGSRATSDYVVVDQRGTLDAGADGITAVSSAGAYADLSQSATQGNTNTQTISRDDTTPEDLTIAAQLVGLLQVNASAQLGLSIVDATSGPVEVQSDGNLYAGGNGVTASSEAYGTANLSQDAAQTNSNSADATGALVVQGQAVGQLNLNIQAGAAVALTTSDYVKVDQSGYLAAGGNGITATSSAQAGASLTQNATQDNSNSATAGLAPVEVPVFALPGVGVPDLQPLAVEADVPQDPYPTPTIDVAAALQGQLVGQVNLNGQLGVAFADAASGHVSVDSAQDPSGGNGITAESSAGAGASFAQNATQSNSNSASITLPPLEVASDEPTTDGGELELPGFEAALQLEGVLQLNASLQAGAAIATATSDYVDLNQTGVLSAGGDGINATSSATAVANLTQTVGQTNSDTKDIARALADTPQEGDTLHPRTLAAQLELALQANANVQLGVAAADATSAPVEVDSSDQVDAGGNGINASSYAEADGYLTQSADQSNTSSMNAEGGLVLQGQLVGQLNLNIQAGAAIATATSDDVKVDQSGSLSAGGNGLTASSSAYANANLDQTASQANSNSANATLVPGDFSILRFAEFPSEPTIAQVDAPQVSELQGPSEAEVLRRLPIFGGIVGAQGQLVGQANLNLQLGAAYADATSSYVEVDSFEDPSGGNGITADSSAAAYATLNQSVDQSNSNNASITLPPLPVVSTVPDGETGDAERVVRFFDPEFALQLEGVLQANASLQAGSASASAYSDEVDVDQSGLLSAGGDALTAKSDAVAVANLSQTASQSNEDTKTIDRAEGPTPQDNEVVIPVPTGDVQIEAALQANLNLQLGSADAYATSGPVDVHSQSTIDAGGNGLTAESSAGAGAYLTQSADQSNSNSAEATGGTLDFIGTTDSTIRDGTGVFQLQLAGQLNLNVQEGEARASAFADQVDVLQNGGLFAGGNGVTATSAAYATADLEQTASQNNSNTGTATLESAPLYMLIEAPQFIIQANANIQDGDAYAYATSSDVRVYANQDPSGGDGVTAASIAVADATLTQTADQSNSNSVSVTGPEEGFIELRDDQPLIVQANLSIQQGEAIAYATSGDVDVTKSGDLSAGGQGVGAQSVAVASAPITQSVSQSNGNSQSATGDTGLIGQRQGDVIQANINGLDFRRLEIEVPGQEAFALAAAESGKVEVWNTGGVSAGTGNGIDAESAAVATSPVIQNATQSNTNSQTATLTNPEAKKQGINQLQDLVVQGNSNVQDGVSISAAESGPVEVWNEGDIYAGGDGIRAASTAVADASVAQGATQSNNNSQNANLGSGEITQVQGQKRLSLLQLNLNKQDGTAVALATSGDVEVRSKGFIDPGVGIYAHSDAAANASVDQNATQANSNNSNATVSSDADVLFGRSRQIQVNKSEQYGTAVAVSTSGEVTVEQTGGVAAGGNGIDAASTALATASVDQSVSQSNENAENFTVGDQTINIPVPSGQLNEAEQEGIAVALALANDVSVTQSGNISVGGDGIKAVSKAAADASVTQSAEQQNSNEDGLVSRLTQDATSVAIAVAGRVSVDSSSWSFSSGDDGIVGVSAASANAVGGNTPLVITGVAYEGYDEYAATGYQPHDWALMPFNPDAFAYAEADKVDINFTGNMYAQGNGIVAISKATAYAEADANTGNAAAIAKSDNVDVTVSGNIWAQKNGIVAASIADAQAVGGGDTYTKEKQGNVTVEVKSGTVSGGKGYYGVVVLGGDRNVITIGKGGTVTSQGRHAILGGDQDEKVQNYGLVDGDVDLGLGMNAFNNYAGARFYSASIINLNGGQLWNAGLLSPGGPGFIQSSNLNGSLVQTASGSYGVDLELKGPTSDFVHATGTAVLDGKVLPTIIANPASGKHQVTILTADGGVTNNGIGVKDTAIVDYSLKFPNANDVVLKTDVNFAPNGLNKDAKGVGSSLNKAFKKGGSNSMQALGLSLVQLPTVSAVANAYNQLSGANYSALGVAELQSQERFSEDQMSCPVRDGGAWAFIDENQCVYARVRYRNLQQDASGSGSGFDEDAIGVMGGAQWAWNGPWHAGVAFGYENSDLTTDSPQVSSNGDRYRVGGSLKYIAGPWLVGGGITGNWSNYDSSRQIAFPGFSSTANSSQDFSNIGGQMRVAYQIGSAPQLGAPSSWYAKPLVDFMVTNVDMGGFTERGGSGAGLRVSGFNETVFSATPAIEVGNQWAMSGGTLIRPYVRGGVSFYSDANFPVSAGFAAASGGITPFTTAGQMDDVLGNISAGLAILGVRGSVLSFSYDGSFGDTITEHSASAKASVRF
jgi:Autotransporter beta-domain